jgi:hypothetical protein
MVFHFCGDPKILSKVNIAYLEASELFLTTTNGGYIVMCGSVAGGRILGPFRYLYLISILEYIN